jgi:hypothetical protein
MGWVGGGEEAAGVAPCAKVDGSSMAAEIPDGWADGQVGM